MELQILDKKLFDKAFCLETLQKVYLCRIMDEKMWKLVRQNKGGTFHLSTKGHELIGVLFGQLLTSKKDWLFPYYRDRSVTIGLGCDLVKILSAHLARGIKEHSSARQMPEHFSDMEYRIPCQSSCVGSQFLQAVGRAYGIKRHNLDEIVYVSGGDGSTSQGDFHEALNFSSIHRLPILFFIQDNGYAISVTSEEQTAGGKIENLVSGYPGVKTIVFDGTDFSEAYQGIHQAITHIRQKEGPVVVIGKIPRIGPHSSSDDPKKYKSEEICQKDLEFDPVRKLEQWLLQEEYVSQKELQSVYDDCFEKVEIAAKKADEKPFPEPVDESQDVLKPVKYCPLSATEIISNEPIVMMDALNHALSEEMQKDSDVIVFGQDVAKGKGGVFGITRTLTDQFGQDRCFNTPLAESTIVGLAIGLSLDGKHKPVAEIQFCDYSWTSMNQIINELSSMYYRSNGMWNCPVVIRMPYGGYIQGGPYHSQCIEGYLAHCPGLKIVIPSNAYDAKGLLKASIQDPNPVIFLEHKALYRQRAFVARPEPKENVYLPLGKANIVREGTDITVITWAMTTVMSAEIADQLTKEGYSVEVIDLRTIAPLDIQTILTSVKKTGKVLIVHEAAKTGGFGGEISAQIQEQAFEYLDAPIQRIAAKDCPVPYSKILEDSVLPQKVQIESKIREMISY